MPQTQAQTVKRNIGGGLITEAPKTAFPDQASIDENNCVNLLRFGKSRRKGIDYEDGFVYFSQINELSAGREGFSTFVWTSVDNNPTLSLLVVQVEGKLLFFKMEDEPYSDNILGTTIDLEDHIASNVTFNAARGPCQFASGEGKLFVVNPFITPFYVSFDNVTETLTTTPINLKIRDFEGIDDGLDVAERPSVLSNDHKYNLINQGWPPDDRPVKSLNAINQGIDVNAIESFNSGSGVFEGVGSYPSHSDIWYVNKIESPVLGLPIFVPTVEETQYTLGNTLAPKGHFILDAFNRDRQKASGIPVLSSESFVDRPETVAFFAGRVWFGYKNRLLFSQVLAGDLRNAEKCYQLNDPTSENLSDLLATDGGELVFEDIPNFKVLIPLGSSLLCLSDTKVLQLDGPEGVFKATDFRARRISNIGIASPESAIVHQNQVFFWSAGSVNIIIPDQITGDFSVQNITDATIKSFINDNLNTGRAGRVVGELDEKNNRLIWLFRDLTDVTIGALNLNASSATDFITNRDFELGDLTGWSATGSNTPFADSAKANSGTFSARLGSSSDASGDEGIFQDVPVQVAWEGVIDSGNAHFLLSAFIRAESTADDELRLELEFYDGSMMLLSSTVGQERHHENFFEDAIFSKVPANTRTIRVIFRSLSFDSGLPRFRSWVDDVDATIFFNQFHDFPSPHKQFSGEIQETTIIQPIENPDNVPESHTWGNTGTESARFSYSSNATGGVNVSGGANAAGDISNVLQLTNWGFIVPEDALITGVQVDFTTGSFDQAFQDFSSRLTLDNGVTASLDNKALGTSFDSQGGVIQYGGDGDVWGQSLTPAIVNSDDFGIRLIYKFTSSPARTMTFGPVSMTVYYTTFTGGGQGGIGTISSESGVSAARGTFDTRFNRALMFDLNDNSWHPWTFGDHDPDSPNSSPWPRHIWREPDFTLRSTTEIITTIGETVTAVGDTVTITGDLKGLKNSNRELFFLCVEPITPESFTYRTTFGSLRDENFKDWLKFDNVGLDIDSNFTVGYHVNDDLGHFMYSPYVYVLSEATETGFDIATAKVKNPSSLLMTPSWDWEDFDSGSVRVGPQVQVYKYRKQIVNPGDGTFPTTQTVVESKNKVRGKGRSLQLKFDSEPEKDFKVLGYQIEWNINAGP